MNNRECCMAKDSIGKTSGENQIGISSESWNIADSFMKIKVLRLMIEIDLDETIARFGRKDMEEYVPSQMIAEKRVEALQRMLFSLKQLIGNCLFSISNSKDKRLISSYMDRLENVEKVIDGTYFEVVNDVTKETFLKVNEQHFNKCFGVMRQVKNELNFPINRAGLIFKQSDDIDLEKIMQDIVGGG